MANLTPNPSFSLELRLKIPNQAGMLAKVLQAIGTAGGNVGHIDLIERTRSSLIRTISLDASSTGAC